MDGRKFRNGQTELFVSPGVPPRKSNRALSAAKSTSAVGRDTISHPDRVHDDVANAVAGAAALSKFGGYDTSMRWVSVDDDAWQRVRLQTFINSEGRIRL